MIELMPTFTELPVAEILVPDDRLRGVTEPGVAALMEMIGTYAFTTPITVRRTGGQNVLIDGAHRLEAMTRLGHASIAVRAYDCSAAEARGLEIGGNLAGAAMSVLDDAVFLAAWKRLHEQEHPETRGGIAGALARHGLQRNYNSFAEIIAEKRSISTRQVRKMVAAGEVLGTEEVRSLRNGKRRITLSDIQQIATIVTGGERRAVVDALAGGTAKNAAAARSVWKVQQTGGSTPLKTPVEAEFLALKSAWTRASEAARKRFCTEHSKDIWMAQNKGLPRPPNDEAPE